MYGGLRETPRITQGFNRVKLENPLIIVKASLLQPVEHSLLKRLLISVVAVVIAILLTFAIKPLFGGKAPLAFFTIAVVLTAAYGGLWAGICTTLLSVALVSWLFEYPTSLLLASQSGVTLLGVIGVVISVVMGLLHKSNAEAARAGDQLRQANEQLSQRTEELSRSNEELERFAHALSHDLRAPLQNINALTSLLLRRNDKALDAESKECAHLIVSGAQRMEEMIKGLLDYASATSVDQHHTIATDCNAVIERVLQDLRYVIEASGAVVTFSALPVVHAHEDRLVRVFSNIITNAIKYRGERPPEIQISGIDRGQEYLFSVKDNGIGINMRYADQIFEMFKRLHTAEEYEGTGIGLAVCKAVIDRHGGRIWVESEPCKGSTFFFTLPKRVRDESAGLRKPIAMEGRSHRARAAER